MHHVATLKSPGKPCGKEKWMNILRHKFYGALIVSLLLVYGATSAVDVYSKSKDDSKGKDTKPEKSQKKSEQVQSAQVGKHVQVQIEANGVVRGGQLQGATIKVEANAKFKPTGEFIEGRIQIKLKSSEVQFELKVPISDASHLHPPAAGDHTDNTECAVPNPSGHLTSTATGLNIQLIGGAGTSNIILQGLSPILKTYADFTCLTGKTQIENK